MKKNYLVGGFTAIAFFSVVGYDYYTGNISIFAKKVVENGPSGIADVSGDQDVNRGGVAPLGAIADISALADISAAATADISAAATADISALADISAAATADISAAATADISGLGTADIAAAADLLANSDLLGGIQDVGGLLANSDLLGGIQDLSATADISAVADISATADISAAGTGIEDDFRAGKVSVYNFPNPANDITNFRFQLNEAALVRIVLYGANGQMIAMALNKQYGAGEFIYSYDVSALTPGTYVYTYQLGNNLPMTRKLMIK